MTRAMLPLSRRSRTHLGKSRHQRRQLRRRRLLIETLEDRRLLSGVSPTLVWEYDTPGAYSLAVSADGGYVAVGASNGLHFLDEQGNSRWTYNTSNPVLDLAMPADATEIAAVVQSDSSWGGGGPVQLFDRDGNQLYTISDSHYSSVAYSPQGDYYAVTYESWTGWYDQAALWDRSSGWLWYDRTIGESGSGSVSVSANGITATGAAMMGTTSSAVRVYGRTWSLTWTYPMSGTIGAEYSVAITTDGNYVVAGNSKNTKLHFLDVPNKQELWQFETGDIQGVSVSSHGAYVVAGASDAVYLFDTSGSLLWTKEIAGVRDVALSADASLIVVATASGRVYGFDVSTDPPQFGINQWWATVGDDEISVTWTTEVSVRDQYFLDLDIERWNSWDLTEEAEVTFNGQTADFNGSGTANLGELSPGVYQFTISSFAVPDAPVVEEITFQLIRDVFGPLNPSRDLTTLFVADHAETNLPSSFRIQDADVCKDLPSVQALVDHFAPILHFDLGERYAMPFDVQISLDADARSRVDGLRVNGNADDNLDLSDLASGEWSPESSTPTVYASVLVCPAGHASCQAGQELAINYWLHYPRSNWSDHHGYNTHEGDWEGATVFLKLEGGVWTPDRVAFGQHIELLANFGGFASTDGGDVVSWDHLDREGSQSHWYVGLGGHATYSVSGTTTWWNVSEDFPWFDRYEESHTGNGKSFHSQGHVEYLPRVGDSSVPSWLLYPGFWGDDDLDDDGSLLDGDQAPRGPVFQDLAVLSVIDKAGQRWLDPWAWSDGFSTPPKAIHADQFDINVDNDIVLARAGEYLVVSVDGVVVWNTTVAGSTDSLMIYGQTGNDTLTIDFSNGDPLPSGGLTFVGGDGAGNQFDTLVVANGVFQNVVNTLLSPHAGTIQLDGQLPITYVGLAPVDFIGDQIANLTIHLPDGADGALIEDAGDVDDGLWRIRSADSPPTFEQTTFPSPSDSLTINANGGDTVTVASFDSLFSTPNMTFGGTSGGNWFELSASERLPNAAAVTLTGDAELHLNGYTETIGSLSDPTGGTRVSLAGGTLVTGGNHASTTFAGDISGNGVLTKTGNGVFRLTGAAGVGAATVEAGALLINGTLTAEQDVQVHSGGTLGGTGTIAASAGVSVSPGATLDPGELDLNTDAPLPGWLTVNGNVRIEQGATFRVQLGGLNPGAGGYDQLTLHGTIDVGSVPATPPTANGGTLSVSIVGGFTVPVGATFRIVDNDETELITTRFDGLPEGDFLYPGGVVMNISYLSGLNNNDVTLTAPGRFDFNGFNNFTAPNYMGVTGTTVKTDTNAYGWDAPIHTIEWQEPVGPQTDYLLRDVHAVGLDTVREFRVDVVPGRYQLTVLTGFWDHPHDRERFDVYDPDNPGGMQTKIVDTGLLDQSEFKTVRFEVTIGAGGRLYLRMQDLEGNVDNYETTRVTVIAALDIRPLDTVGVISIARTGPQPVAADPLPADGLTLDTYTGTNSPPYTMLTVRASNQLEYLANDVTASDLGTIPPGDDKDLYRAYTQVYSDANGNFSFQLQRPTGVGPVFITVETAAGTEAVVSPPFPLTEDTFGLSRGTYTQNYVLPDTRLLDFNGWNAITAADYPGALLGPENLQEDYVGVPVSQTYDAASTVSTNALGWNAAPTALPLADFDRGGPDALLRDGHYGYDSEFLVDLSAAGNYLVNTVIGDVAPFRLDQVNVYAEGAVTPQLTVNTTAGEWTSSSFVVSSDTQLSLRLRDAGGTNPYWLLNALRVRPAPDAGDEIQISGPAGPLDADGTTVDTFTGTIAATAGEDGFLPDGALVTVATTLGTIDPAQDQSATYQGVQVVVSGGQFSFTIQRPSGTGNSTAPYTATATITAQEVLGRNLGSTTRVYQPQTAAATVLRFDMGIAGGPVHDGFTAVGPRDIFNATRGYGWSTRVAAADRPWAATNNGFSPLNRDFHTGSDAKFRVQLGELGSGGTYHVRVYLSNPYGTNGYQYTYDNFEVRVEDNSTYPDDADSRYKVALLPGGRLPAGQVTIADLTGSPGEDNILDIWFIDTGGGQNLNWVVSGIEISSGSLPAAIEKLLANEAGSASGGGVTIDHAMLAPLVAEAAARWSATDLTPAQSAVLSDLHVGVADLGGATLGLAYQTTNEIRIDDDAARWGWAVTGDRSSVIGDGLRITDYRSPITGLDLRHTLLHEIGHLLGYEHSADADDLMAPVLSVSSLGSSFPILHPSSLIAHPSSPRDDVFAELGRDRNEATTLALPESKDEGVLAAERVRSSDEAAQAKVPRRSRMERYVRELDEWFAELSDGGADRPAMAR